MKVLIAEQDTVASYHILFYLLAPKRGPIYLWCPPRKLRLARLDFSKLFAQAVWFIPRHVRAPSHCRAQRMIPFFH